MPRGPRLGGRAGGDQVVAVRGLGLPVTRVAGVLGVTPMPLLREVQRGRMLDPLARPLAHGVSAARKMWMIYSSAKRFLIGEPSCATVPQGLTVSLARNDRLMSSCLFVDVYANMVDSWLLPSAALTA